MWPFFRIGRTCSFVSMEKQDQFNSKHTNIEYILEKDVLTVLGISRATLWRLRKKFLIQPYKIEGLRRVYYKRDEINALIKPDHD